MATPLWSIGAVPIFISTEDKKPDTRLSEHVILDGDESVIHRFGYGSGVLSLSGHILGDTGEYDILEGYYHNQDIVALVSDQGAEGNFRIWSLTRKRLHDISRTNPVYQVTIELKSTG